MMSRAIGSRKVFLSRLKENLAIYGTAIIDCDGKIIPLSEILTCCCETKECNCDKRWLKVERK